MKRLFLGALMVLVGMVGMTAVIPVTAAAADKGIPEVLDRLNMVLETQQRLLNQVNNIQNTTLPNQGNLLTQIKGLQDSIRADLLGLIKEVDGLQLLCTTPDLLPLPNAQGDFCRLDTSRSNLLVRVYNQGGGNAGSSTTSVFFRVPDTFNFTGSPYSPCATSGCAQLDVDTDPLAGFGGSEDRSFAIPSACYDIDLLCKFKISVDALNAVTESNEANNNAGGQCAGQLF